MQQPGTVILDIINMNHTYLATANYWAPLQETETDDNVEQINVRTTVQSIAKTKSNKWTRRVEQIQTRKLVIGSGAKSNFVSEEMNLPKKGKSNKEVFSPNNSTLHTSYKTELPFTQLTAKAREADIFPGLKTPFVSVNKMAEEGYTTIFHPREEGVRITNQAESPSRQQKHPFSKGANQKDQNYGKYQKTKSDDRKSKQCI